MPSITFWTRLEPYTRRDDIDVGLAARVHDPLWMLARQWQTGEFHGEDGGTPVQVQARMRRSPLARFHAGPVTAGTSMTSRPYRGATPLETRVEAEGPYITNDPRRDMRFAAEVGLMFLRHLDRAGASAATRAAFLDEPTYRLPAAPNERVTGPDRAGREYLAVMAGRLPDGIRIYLAFNQSLNPPPGTEPGLPPRPDIPTADRPAVLTAGRAFVDWYESRITPPIGDATAGAWLSERMEYSFGVSVAVGSPETGTGVGDLVLSAAEYPGGNLDWYAFDVDFNATFDDQPSGLRPELLTRTAIPAPVRYLGIAADRWWQFEDAAVNLSRIDGDPDELVRLLLVEFALLYSNDWYLLPVDLTPGATYDIWSLVVTDAFGERTLVPHHHSRDQDEDRPGWNMFSLTPSTNLHFIPPVIAGGLQSDPIEDVYLLREEVSNLVWAVERAVPSLAGGVVNREALYRMAHQLPDTAPVADNTSALAYRLATTVPDHWIPFQPRRITPNNPQVRLQRAAALLDRTGTPLLSQPQGRILEPRRPDLSLFEEEVPPSGIRLTRHYQYARWIDGRTVLWLSRRKTPGRIDQSSGLSFDLLDEVEEG
jgi:hypothetical protein